MAFSDETFGDPKEASRSDVEQAIMAWRGYRQQRLVVESEAKRIKEREDFYKSYVLEAFKQQKFEGMIIGGRITGLSTRSVPAVEDKEALVAHILETGQLDLLQFKISTEAVKARWQEDLEVPGVGETEVYDLYDRQVK